MDFLKQRKKMKKQIREITEKKEQNERLIKDRLIRDFRTLFEQDEGYYKPERVSNFWSNNYIECESNGDKNRNLSLDEYLDKTEPYLSNMIIDFQNSDTWKIELTIAINFIFSKDAEEERVMHSSRDNIKFTSYSDADEVIDELFKSLCSRYQANLETSMRGSDFIFDALQLMYYKCHRVNSIRGGLCIDSPDWIEKKKS